jgi:hypothetical protein
MIMKQTKNSLINIDIFKLYHIQKDSTKNVK